MTGENGYPDTPDWHPEPRVSPFDKPVALVVPPNIELSSE